MFNQNTLTVTLNGESIDFDVIKPSVSLWLEWLREDAVREMVSIIAWVVFFGKDALEGGTRLEKKHYAAIDRVAVSLKMLKAAGCPLDLDEFNKKVMNSVSGLHTRDDCFGAWVKAEPTNA